MVPTNLLGTYASALHMTQGFLFFDLGDLTHLPALNELWGFFPSIFFPLPQSWSLILHTCSLIMQSITQTIPMQISGSLYLCNFLFSGTLPCKFRQPQSPEFLVLSPQIQWDHCVLPMFPLPTPKFRNASSLNSRTIIKFIWYVFLLLRVVVLCFLFSNIWKKLFSYIHTK